MRGSKKSELNPTGIGGYEHKKHQRQGRTEEAEARGAEEATAQTEADGASRLSQAQGQEEGTGRPAAAEVEEQ
jgi:hypothetical protein